jgi:hypothetical protein
VFYKIASSGESSVSVPDTGNYTAGQIFAFRGVDTVSPINASGSNITNGAAFTAGGVTTTAANCMVVMAASTCDFYSYPTDTSNLSSWANSNLSSVTEAEDSIVGTYMNKLGIACAYGVKSSAGPTGSTTATPDDVTNFSAVVTLALTPA